MTTIRTLIAGTVAAAALTIAPAVASSPDYGPHHTQRMAIPRWMTRPCPTEDSDNCYWRAPHPEQGGRSFYARRMPHTGRVCIFYVRRSDARVSDQCYRR